MRKAMALVALAATAFTGIPASAHEGPNTTHGGIGGAFPEVGSGVVVVGYCRGDANEDSGWVALATTVYCTVNGEWYRSQTVTMPGPTAVTATVTTATEPLRICVYSQAVFYTPFGATDTSDWVEDCYQLS